MGEVFYQVTVGETKKEYAAGTTYREIAEDFQKDYDARIVLAMVDKKLNELHKKLVKDCEITFKTVKDRTGYKTYRRSVCLLLVKAIHDVVGDEKLKKIKIEFSVSKGYFVNAYGDFTIDQEFLNAVKARMDEMVAADIPITKQSFALDDAISMFRERGMKDKERLFR